jgi:hypothetical protein
MDALSLTSTTITCTEQSVRWVRDWRADLRYLCKTFG